MLDIYPIIISCLSYTDKKTCRIVSKKFSEWTNRYLQFHPLIPFIETYPEAPWCWRILAQNTSLPVEYVYNHFKINNKYICQREDIIKIRKYPGLFISDKIICKYGTYDIICCLSKNTYLGDVIKNSKLSFCEICKLCQPCDYDLLKYFYINENEGVPREFMLNNIRYYDQFTKLFSFSILYLDDLDNFTYIDYEYLSKNPNINIQYVIKNINEQWNWSWLSQNIGISINDIINNIGLNWDFVNLQKHPYITQDDIITINLKIDTEYKLDIAYCRTLKYEDVKKIIETSNDMDIFYKLSFNDFGYK